MEIQFWIDNANSFFHQIFMIVMGGLMGIAVLFGTTYNVVNIVVYFILIPASWLYLISRKTSPWINAVSILALITFFIMPNSRGNCNYLFNKSVDFLNWSAKIFGSNYIDMSVYICVVAVTLVYVILIPLTLSKSFSKKAAITTAILLILYLIIVYPNFRDILLWSLKKMNVNY